MPQFDFTTYSSQVFWLIICFALLYSFTQFIILPRIRDIIKERKNIVDADRSKAESLDSKIYDIENETDKLTKEAVYEYQSKLEEANKQALKQREKLLEDLKEKVETMTKNSRQELKSFVEKSNQDSETAVQNLVKTIKEKFLNFSK